MKFFWFFLICISPVFVFSQVFNDSCHQAVELFCGNELWVDLNGAGNDTPEYFEDCGTAIGEVGVWYLLVGTGDYIHLSSCHEYSLNIKAFEGTCDSLTCLSSIMNFPTYQCDANGNKEVAFLSKAGKPYYIYCRSNSILSFGRLSISCYPPLPNDICGQAKPIVLDSTYTYDHRFATPSNHESCLDSYYQAQPDGWYTFYGNGDYIQVDKFSGSLLTSCLIKDACNSMEFVEFDHIAGDRAYPTEAGVKYYLQIVNTNLQPQQFRLRSFQLAGNDICSGAEPFPLQDTLTLSFKNTVSSVKACTTNEGTYDRWYYFTGNDSIVTFTWTPYTPSIGTRVKILTGTCDSLVCETMTRSTNQVSVPTISGKRYWVNIHNSNAYEFDTPVEVTATVTAHLENDKYTGAIPIQCGDTLQGTLAYALEDLEINGSRETRSVWYRIIGTGEYYSINAIHPLQSFDKKIFTWQDETLVLAPGNSPSYKFLKKDSTYFLNIVGSYNTYFNDFELSLSCHPVDEQDICESALPVSVADTTWGNMRFTLQNTFDSCSSYGTKPDGWYRFIGDGRLKDLVFENIVNDQVFGLLQGTCDSLTCITHWFNYYNEPSTSRRIFLREGITYFLKVQGRKDNLFERKFRFYFRDLGPAANDLCHNAQLVSCGETINASMDYVSPCDYADPCLSENEKRIWYELIGQGDTIDISLTGYAQNEGFISMEIYEGDCCNLPQINPVSNDQGHLLFFAETEKKYLIAVRKAIVGYDGRFDLHIDCKTNGQTISQIDENRSSGITSGKVDLSANCPEESLACRDTISISVPHLYSQVFDAGQIVISSAKMEPPTKVVYRAGDRIVLLPGFHAKANSKFQALIQECSASHSSDVDQYDRLTFKLMRPDKERSAVEELKLEAFPNPLTKKATVRFFISQPCHASLYLYDFQGTRLRSLFSGLVDKDWHTITLERNLLPAGKYVLNLRTPNGIINQPIVIAN